MESNRKFVSHKYFMLFAYLGHKFGILSLIILPPTEDCSFVQLRIDCHTKSNFSPFSRRQVKSRLPADAAGGGGGQVNFMSRCC